MVDFMPSLTSQVALFLPPELRMRNAVKDSTEEQFVEILASMSGLQCVFVTLVIVIYMNNAIVALNEPKYSRKSLRALRDAAAGQVPELAATPPMKVGLLVEPTPFGYVSGYKNRFEEMLKFMKKAGDKVEVVTADREVVTANRDNVAKEFLGFPIATNRGWELPMYDQVTLTYDFAGETPKMIKRFRPDVLHASSPSAIIYPAILWCKIFHIPLVISYHTDLTVYSRTYVPSPPFPGWFGPWLAKFLVTTLHGMADLTLCTSPQLMSNLQEMGLPASHLSVWQKGINADRFNPSFKSTAMRSKMSDGHPEAPLLVYVGRLGAEKRLDRLKYVLDSLPGTRLALVGKGPDAERLKELYKDSPVVFTGELTGDELSAAFASADIFTMPSDSETLGFVVLEAMASGVPVVTVAAGGVLDLVEEGNNGYLADNDDGMVEFTAKTCSLLENTEERAAMASRCRAYAESWSWEAATSKLRNLQYHVAVMNHKQAALKSRIGEEEEKELLENAGKYMAHLV